MATTAHSTTLETRLISLLDDLKVAEDATDGLSDDLSFDVGILLYRAKAALQEARDLLDALPPFDARDAEPQSYTSAGRTIHSYTPPAEVIARQRAAQAALDECFA
jgi:hypothetical protein